MLCNVQFTERYVFGFMVKIYLVEIADHKKSKSMDHKSWNTLHDCKFSAHSWQDPRIDFKHLHITSIYF